MDKLTIDWTNGDWMYALDEATKRTVSADDIADTIAASEGCHDEADWLAIMRMKDGRYAFLAAGCDYTGWDCRAWGSIDYAPTLEELCRLNMDDEQRARLGVDVFGVFATIDADGREAEHG